MREGEKGDGGEDVMGKGGGSVAVFVGAAMDSDKKKRGGPNEKTREQKGNTPY